MEREKETGQDQKINPNTMYITNDTAAMHAT